ncbi:MAG: 50S ribosomal protein L25 [Niameybacter sp.]|uniref:50S ribosomal protein L25 n=1 Tax=Niameybacter sp. TaxID=2033640 RepID=UPI002FCA0081
MPQKIFKVMPRTLNQSLLNLRTKGLVPGIMYGQSLKTSIPIQIPFTALQSMINDTSTMTFSLELDGETYNCVLRDFQTDRLHTTIIHVDFQFVKPGEHIKMSIPMSYEGIEHLRSKKYLLEKAISRIPVKGCVDILPEAFVVNTGEMERGAKIFVSDLQLPKGVELLINPETIIATVQ